MIHSFPLVVVVMLNINVSVNNWLHHIHEEEEGDRGEHESGPVSGEANIKHAVALEGAERLPPELVSWLDGERDLLLAEAWNVHVHAALQFRLDFEALNHLNNLSLLLSSSAVCWTNLFQVLVNFVLHFTYYYIMTQF